MIAAGWLGGALTVHLLPALPSAGIYVPLGLTALLALRTRVAYPIVWVVAGFVWTAQCAAWRLDDRLPAAGDFPLTGWVDDFPTAAPGQSTFSFSVAEPRPIGVPRRLRLTWYDPPPGLAAGAALEVVARLKPPRGLRNPGGFDYERWLLVEGYGATGYVRSGQIEPERPAGLARTWLLYRARLAERIAAATGDADGAALLTALAIGERFRFEERHWTAFRRTGTSHLVAVSGMHVGLLGLVLFVLTRRLWLWLPGAAAAYDLEAAAAVSLLGTLYYAALTGFAVPAQRSLFMIATALALTVTRLSVGVGQGLAAALLGVLLWDPLAPLSASFWLSFGAVGVLMWLSVPRTLRVVRPGRASRVVAAARDLLRLQWNVSRALLPLTAAFFAQVSLVGVAVNLIAIPWFTFVLVPMTLVATVAASDPWLGTTLAPLLWQAAGSAASVTAAALDAVAAIPWAAVHVPTLAWPVTVLAVVGTFLALPVHPLPGRSLAWLALLPLALPAARPPEPGAVRLQLLDVGHGLAVIVETHAHRLLYDAGPRFPSGFDAGLDVVVPALRTVGRDLDLVIVSHADNDHAGGVPSVLAEFPSARVLEGPDVHLRGSRCERGQRWRWDGVEFAVVHPPAGFIPRGNDSSCVLRVSTGGHAVLIAGDIELRGESALANETVAADVVIVPHHGSATSSSPAFVNAVGADFALVSAGYGNRWGFPKPAVRARWERAGAAVLVTGDRGAITVTLGSRGVTLSAARMRRRRYWDARS